MPNSHEIVIRQYEAVLASTDTLWQRRDNLSRLFILTNAALIGFISAVAGNIEEPRWLIALTAAGLAISFAWAMQLFRHQTLARARTQILESIESELLPAAPLARARERSKELGGRFNQLIRGVFPPTYFLPAVFALLHIALTIALLQSADGFARE